MKRWIVGAIIAIIVFVAVYTLINPKEQEVKLFDCKGMPADLQDQCCANQPHEITVACVGNWKFNESSNDCIYECTQSAVS
jgi:hypothetical protein